MFNFKFKQQDIQDISFGNVFYRKFIIRLAIVLPLIFVIILMAQSAMVDQYHKNVDGALNGTALEIIDILESKTPDERAVLTINELLAQFYEDAKLDPMTRDMSLSIYNMSKKQIIAKSFELPVVLSEDAKKWWADKSETNIGTPKVSMSQEMVEFCQKHRDEKIYITEMIYLNQLLIPVEIETKDTNGRADEQCSMMTQSVSNDMRYNEEIELKLIGNTIDDPLYGKMTNYKIQKEDELDPENDNVIISYSLDFPRSSTMLSKNFTINDVDYQIDCLYQESFWYGYILNVVAIELFAILACAFVAFINTRELLKTYQE